MSESETGEPGAEGSRVVPNGRLYEAASEYLGGLPDLTAQRG